MMMVNKNSTAMIIACLALGLAVGGLIGNMFQNKEITKLQQRIDRWYGLVE